MLCAIYNIYHPMKTILNKILSNPELVIAGLAFCVSIIGLWLSIRALKIQRQHNYMSVKPIGKIKLGDYENTIFVKIANSGVGPLIIKELKITNQVDIKDNLIDYCDLDLPEGLTWKDFVKNLIDRVIRVDEDLFLIEIVGLDEPLTKDHVRDYAEFKTRLRNILSNLTIELKYTDIYEKNLYTETRKLDWFKRT
jgi:hypothetical protein